MKATMTFTDKETAALRAMWASSRGNGHDFGFTEDVQVDGLTWRQLAGVVRCLHKKLDLSVYDEQINGVHQFVVQEWTGGKVAYETTFDEWLQSVTVAPAPALKPAAAAYTVCPPKRKPETDEWMVRCKVDGKVDENKTYYTDDKADAWSTYRAMAQRQSE